MKRNVYWSLCAAAIGMALLTAALTLWSAHGLLVRQVQQELRDEHKLIARSVAYTGEERLDYLSSLDIRFDSFRVTLITPEGGVLFDSDNDRAGMENHLDRPEVREALSVGSGEDIRRSETMGLDTCYYAAALPDGSVLRVSKQTRSIGAVFAGVIPLMAGIVLVTLLLSMLLASRLTRRLVRPVEALAEDLENTDSLRGYEELEPFYRKLREKNRLIGEQMERLRAERDTIKTITSNMKEGLLLLGGRRRSSRSTRRPSPCWEARRGNTRGKTSSSSPATPSWARASSARPAAKAPTWSSNGTGAPATPSPAPCGRTAGRSRARSSCCSTSPSSSGRSRCAASSPPTSPTSSKPRSPRSPALPRCSKTAWPPGRRTSSGSPGGSTARPAG